MIKFNDGKISETYPYFAGTVCTIYESEPNISGFFFDGMDCSDFCTLYRQGDDYYQLSNDGRVCADETEEVVSREEASSFRSYLQLQREIAETQKLIEEKKRELSDTDYIIIKKAEGLDMSEYDMETVSSYRQELRDDINELRLYLEEISQSKKEGVE